MRNMQKQFYSDDYVNEVETTELINEIYSYLENEQGTIFYKFPTVKEFDKMPVVPDIFVVSESVGVLSVLVDTMMVSRDADMERMIEKIELVDNYVYTTLLKNRNLKLNARSLKLSVSTIGYCPNIQTEENENLFVSVKAIIEKIKEIQAESSPIDIDIIEHVISSLEASAVIIKPKERILSSEDINSKATILKEIETKIARFDDEQRISALSLLEGPQRIRGLAGSGKTIILCLKAANLHMIYPEARILYTFYTKSLYDYIVQLITRFYMKLTDGQLPDFNKISVLHAWGGKQVPGVYYEACRENGITPLTYKDSLGYRNPFSYICKEFIDATQNSARKMYDYVLIDEAQDFESPFYQLCRSIVKDDHLVWCYDEVQNIFDVVIQNSKETFANEYDENGIDLARIHMNHPEIRNDIVLHKSYRNVRKILMVAVALGFGIYSEKLVQSLENNSHWEDLGFRVISGDCSKEENVVIERAEGASPLLVEEDKVSDCIILNPAVDFRTELEWITNQIYEAITKDKLLPEDIAVICLDQKNALVYVEELERRLGEKGIGTFNVLDRNYVKGFYRENKVTLSSVSKAKGNEAAMVFVCGCDAFERKQNERKMRNMIFTAFTRAKVWLRISGTGTSSLNQIKHEIEQLESNELRFCFKNKPNHLLDKDWNEINSSQYREEEIRRSIEQECRRLGISVDQYLYHLQSIPDEEEKRIDE